MKTYIQISKSLLNLGLFYHDIVKDIIVLYILSYVENAILSDEDLKTKFDTVGGINFPLLIVYLAMVLVISEAAIYWQINNRKDMFEKAFNIDPNSRVCRTFVKVFPMHFIFLQKCAANIKVLFLKNKLQTMFDRQNICRIDLMVNEVIRTSNKIEQLENQLYHINKIECEIKVI